MTVVVKGDSAQLPLSDAYKTLEEEESPASTDSTVQGVVRRLIREARDHYEMELLDAQIEATDYYYGRTFGDEEEGRSQVVSTEVRDAVEAVMPSLLRIFLGGDSVCEYKPSGANDVELAKQQTDTVQQLIREQSFLTFMNTFDDALLRRLGAVKAWYDKNLCIKEENFSELSMEQLAMLQQQEGVTVSEVRQSQYPSPDGQPLFDAKLTRKYHENKLRIEAIPNEEFWYSPGARTLEECACVIHIRYVTVSDLVSMGIDPEEAKRHAGKRSRTAADAMYDARQFSESDTRSMIGEGDTSTSKVLFGEAYVLSDLDEDDIAERRLFQVIGPDFEIIGEEDGKIVSELPFAVFNIRPLAHMIAGMSLHDLLRDIQRISSQIERGVLNSLALAIENKLIVDDRRVNLADLLNPEILGLIRVNGDPNQLIREVKHQFVGPDALPVLEYYQEKRQERTGITKARQGLDADSLQSSTKQAVAGTFAASQERIEMIARCLAETGMKQLFRLIAKLLVRHQDRALVVKLRGRYVEVDPRTWDANLHVIVNVGLGSGSFEERAQVLQGVAQDQLDQMDRGSPLVTWENLRNTRARMLELTGFKNPNEFYQPWGPEQQQQFEQKQAQNPPQSDPNMLLAQVEQQKAQLNAQIEQMKMQMQMQSDQVKQQMESQKLQLEHIKVMLQDDREREKIAREYALKEYEIELINKREIDDSKLKAKVQADRAEMGGAEE